MDLSPELLAQLNAAVSSGALRLPAPGGRTSDLLPRQLHDLRLLPTKDDARPTFFWSAEQPRHAGDLTKTTDYPRLLWHGQTGTEITVTSPEEQHAQLAMGYVLTPPADLPAPDPMEALKAAWASLSPTDQADLIEAQRLDRIAALRAQLAHLPVDQLETLLQTAEKPAAKATQKGRVA